MENSWIPRPLRLAGLFAAMVAAVPSIMRQGRSTAWITPRFAVWSILLAAFLALFWWLSGEACRRYDRRRLAVLLGFLSIASLGLVALGGGAVGGVFPVLAVTVIVGANLPARMTDLWAGAQGAAMLPAFLVAGRSVTEALLFTLIFGGLQLFVLYTVRVAAGERTARKALEETNRELRSARSLLESRARDAERLEIARELHDVMGHHLAALSLTLEAASRGRRAEVEDRIAEAQVLTKRLLRDVRKVVSEMRSAPGDGLERGLRRLATEVRSPRIHLELDTDSDLNDPETARTLLRCAQEVVTNAVRHSGADNLWLSLRSSERHIVLEARDDGRGDEAPVPGHGLSGMRERVHALDGEIHWESSPGRGFSVLLRIPASLEAES